MKHRSAFNDWRKLVGPQASPIREDRLLLMRVTETGFKLLAEITEFTIIPPDAADPQRRPLIEYEWPEALDIYTHTIYLISERLATPLVITSLEKAFTPCQNVAPRIGRTFQ